jgi:hypothetical protein
MAVTFRVLRVTGGENGALEGELDPKGTTQLFLGEVRGSWSPRAARSGGGTASKRRAAHAPRAARHHIPRPAPDPSIPPHTHNERPSPSTWS